MRELLDQISIVVCYPLRKSEHRRAGRMESHGKEHVEAPHALVPRVGIGGAERPQVPDVLRSVDVWFRAENEHALLLIGLDLEYPGVGPGLLPFAFYRLVIDHAFIRLP